MVRRFTICASDEKVWAEDHPNGTLVYYEDYAALEAQLAARTGGSFPKPDTVSMSEGAIHLDYEVDEARSAAYEWLEAYAYSPALSPAPEAQQEPVAVLEFARNQPGNENEMPRVISCNWLPDGQYKGYTRPAEQAVTEALVERMCRTPFIEGFTPTTDEWQRCETIQDQYDLMKRRIREGMAALKAAMEAGRHE